MVDTLVSTGFVCMSCHKCVHANHVSTHAISVYDCKSRRHQANVCNTIIYAYYQLSTYMVNRAYIQSVCNSCKPDCGECVHYLHVINCVGLNVGSVASVSVCAPELCGSAPLCVLAVCLFVCVCFCMFCMHVCAHHSMYALK